MTEFLENYYDIGLAILQLIGGCPNEYCLGYQIANIVIFVFVMPSLILLFWGLWRTELRKAAKADPDCQIIY